MMDLMMGGEEKEGKAKALLYILHSLQRAQDQKVQNGKMRRALRAEKDGNDVVLPWQLSTQNPETLLEHTAASLVDCHR